MQAKWMTVTEVAEYVGRSTRLVQLAIQRMQIEAMSSGNAFMLKKCDVDRAVKKGLFSRGRGRPKKDSPSPKSPS